MEQQKLPNSTLVLIMGILSIVGCCFYGLPGLIFGIVAIIFGRKDKKLYQSNPDEYSGIDNVNSGYILGIDGFIVCVIFIVILLWSISLIGWENFNDPELLQQKLEELQQNQ